MALSLFTAFGTRRENCLLQLASMPTAVKPFVQNQLKTIPQQLLYAASCSCRCIERFWIVKSRPIYSDNSQEWPKWMELPDKTSWWNPTRLPSSVWTGWPARGPACLSPDLCLWLYWSGRRHPPSCLSSHVSPSPLFLLSLTSPSSSCPSNPFPSIS